MSTLDITTPASIVHDGCIIIKRSTRPDDISSIHTRIALPSVREIGLFAHTTHDENGEHDKSGLDKDDMPNHAWLDELVPVLSEIAQDFHFEKVTLCDFSWGCVTKSTREFLLSRFSSATHLKLCTVDFWYTNELLKTLQSFPRLTQLEIVNCEWEFLNLSQEQATRTEELNLTHLILDEAHTQYDPVVLWLLGNGERAIVNVSSAHIVWENTDARCLVRLMEKIAPSLRNLTYRQKVKNLVECTPTSRGLDGDELTDPSFSAVLAERWTAPENEKVATVKAMELLRTTRVNRGVLTELDACIDWSPLAVFGIELLCQLLSHQATSVSLTLILDSSPNDTEWDTVDELLNTLTVNKTTLAVFELWLDGDLANSLFFDDGAPIMRRLPRLVQQNIWQIGYVDSSYDSASD
ncbi:hypothetical protein IEO21_02890 [Rhodonia placenta]|uniref:Uncharacterized protein n=1 Tax=Rhodonia placenta TaxID=104341 RepID=A0A8H7P6Q9_9APHY|nr:hypothetical protein IEO21_02890 [Postia placenta]